MKLNGKNISLEAPVSLTSFLESQGYSMVRIAAELNGKIIPKAKYGETTVTDADTLEVVTFVGGG